MTRSACAASLPPPMSSVNARMRSEGPPSAVLARTAISSTDVLSTPPENATAIGSSIGTALSHPNTACTPRRCTRHQLHSDPPSRDRRPDRRSGDTAAMDRGSRPDRARRCSAPGPCGYRPGSNCQRDALLAAPREDLIHPLRDDQERPVVHLRDEVAQRNANRPRQPHGPAVARGHGEVSIGRAQRCRVASADGREDIRL